MSSTVTTPVVISGSGLWTPEHTITNEELVLAYNQWANRYNERHAQAIAIEVQDALGIEDFGFDMLVAFHNYHDDLKTGDTGVICSFGAGYSIGSLVMRKR